MGKVTVSEWRTAIVIALVVLLCSSLPYALGYLRQTPDSVFGGALTVASDGERRAMLREYGIVYVFHGPEERALGRFAPQDAPYLAPAYANSEVTIYRVDPSITAMRTSDG